MKFIMFWEFSPEDMDKVVEKNTKLNEERDKAPEKFHKSIIPPHFLHGNFPPMTEKMRGFTLIEANTEDYLVNIVEWYAPELRVILVPISPAEKHVEAYAKFNP